MHGPQGGSFGAHLKERHNKDGGREEKNTQEEKQLSSRRKAPAIKISNGKCQTKAKRRTKIRAELNLNPIRHVRFTASTAKPKQELIDRLRQRNETKRSLIEDRRSLNDEHDDMHISEGKKESTRVQLKQDEDKDKGQKARSRMNLIGQLRQMAAAQSEKMQMNGAAASDSKCKVIKNSGMSKGRTSIGRMEPRTMGEAQVHGSNRSEHRSTNSTTSARYRGSSTLRAALADAAISRLLSKVMPT